MQSVIRMRCVSEENVDVGMAILEMDTNVFQVSSLL